MAEKKEAEVEKLGNNSSEIWFETKNKASGATSVISATNLNKVRDLYQKQGLQLGFDVLGETQKPDHK